MSEVLNPLTLPLQGSQLIEASAGTGKTWTIAALYLRLVLGHGCQALQAREILVMTFTKAATRELSDRIRQRLLEAAARFRNTEPTGPDALLEALREAFPEGPPRQQAAWRLATAAEAMDDASVHTIDAWCQRMLREHAFDSGCLFDEELQPQEAHVLAEATRDYWRQHIYPLGGDLLETVLAQWSDPATLAEQVKGLIEQPLPADAGQGSLADAANRAVQQRTELLNELKAGWLERAEAMFAWLRPIWGDKKHAARKSMPSEAHASRWIEALKHWAQDPSLEQPDLKTGAKRLKRSDIETRLDQAGVAAQVPDCFADFEQLMEALDRLPVVGPTLRLHAAAHVAERLQQIKARSGRFGFADMLHRLDVALDEATNGAKAQRLRERILTQYPVALIDEFQDTSPVQLRIFDRLYRVAENDARRALLLIGDPKQAIYGFRGADIYSYLGAREATRGRHHVLGTNHRSTDALVNAVNTIFGAAEERPGAGAFLFRRDGESEQRLPFLPVQARGRDERLVCASGDVAAVHFVVDSTLRNKDNSRELFAAHCAEAIVTLLNDTEAGFKPAKGETRRLQPADIAVLVRSGTEADAVRRQMRRRGLASVYLSDKDTVFQTPEAADLLRLLQALAAPRDQRLARAASATSLLGFALDELLALSSDDDRFDELCERLQQLHLVWRGQGVLAAVRGALHAFGLPARWLTSSDPTVQGERRLTNVLHLAELLQAASVHAQGEQALLRWFAQQLADGQAGLGGGDELVLRLESDAALVKVVTVHKSKGLEYPVVFLPFVTHFREVVNANEGAKNAVLVLPRQIERQAGQDFAGGPSVVASPTPAQLAAAEQERLREDLRLLYVAMTRARHALWIGLSSLQAHRRKDSCTWHRSAIGYLLGGPAEVAPEQRLADVLNLAAPSSGVAVQQLPSEPELPMPPLTRLRARGAPAPLRAPPTYTAQFERHWSIASYSSLVRDAARGAPLAGSVPLRVLREDEPDDGDAAAAMRGSIDQAWHRFPRGALAGNFLHEQLEWLASEGFALDNSTALQEALVRRCERQGWGHRAEDVVAWLRRVCSTSLPPLGVSLATLETALPEMEFWLPSDGLRAARVDALCRAHLQSGEPRPQLPERTLKGMLMGFADLVFEHQGRYWVLDYKSNALGPRDADYTPAAMNAAMREHRYDVQAALYLLALHRLLKSRLGPAYEPAQHLGGAIYLFLRGIDSRSAGCCVVPPPVALIEELDATMLGAAEAASQDTA